MAIDDPVGIVIRDAEQAVKAGAHLPSQLVKLGFSAALAATLGTKMPWVASILTSLLTASPARFEQRFLRVAEELDAQQRRIEDSIPDKSYYESEEFQSLLILILERIHAAHEDEKLRRFGIALANCGSVEFQSNDRETYIRTLRDLSVRDLQVLNHPNLKGWLPHITVIDYSADVLSSLSRLEGLGLVHDRLEMKRPLAGNAGGSSSDAVRALGELLTNPPNRTYYLSAFGSKFLEFIGSHSGEITSQDQA